MDGLLRSIAAKLDRAEHHLGTLNQTIESGAVSDLVETWTDRDRQGRVRVRVKEIGEIPDQWHVRIGECLHDTRSALDHLAYGLNVIGSGDDPPPNAGQSQFPIYSDRMTYRKGRDGRPAAKLIKHFPRGARTRVQRLQPYTGRKNDPCGARRLADLAELSNIDKHRRFPIVAATPQILQIPRMVELRFPGGVESHRVRAYTSWYRVLKPDTTMVWLEVPSLPPGGPDPKVNLGLGATIEFQGSAANPPVPLLVPHEPVTYTLRQILNFVCGSVLPEFDQWVPGLAGISRTHA